MNATHLHLMLNHVPVLGVAFGFALLAYGLWRKSQELKKTALGLLVLVALLAIPAYLTGEPAEDTVENLPGVSKAIIETHEEFAGVAFTGIIVAGCVALVGLILFRKSKPLPSWFNWSLLSISLVTTGLMAWTANLGGQIRHTEIRSGTFVPVPEKQGDPEKSSASH